MEMTFCIDEISDIIKQQFKNLLQEYSIFIFKGQLGAGKTTMIKESLLSCGVKQVVTSPTFNYVNSYKNAQNQIFNHFDLYRITSEGQFFDLGFDEYFYRKNEWCFIEWPEIIEHLLKEQFYL